MGPILMQSVIMVLIVVLGYVLKKSGLFGKLDYKVLTKIIMYLTLPAVIITGFSKFDWDPAFLLMPVFAILVNSIMLAGGYLLCRRSDDQDKKFFLLNTAGYSMGTFTMPFIQNSLGTTGIVTACMFDIGGTLMPSGINAVACSAAISEVKEKVNAAFVFKKLFTSPPFVAYLVMTIIKASGHSLPEPALLFAGKIGDANAFVCMFMIGLMFELKFQKENITKVAKMIAVRLAAAVGIALLVMFLLPLDLQIRKTLVVILFSPIATLNLIFTDKMGGDVELAGFANSISIVLSMIIMTILMVVFV